MQAIQESKEFLKSVKAQFPEMNEEDQTYYQMEMAKVKAHHAVAYAVKYLGDMIHNHGLRGKGIN